MDMIFYFLPMILFLGIITSRDDIKYGKIRNKWVGAALIYAFVVLALVNVNLQISNVPVELVYFSDYGINLVFAFFVGFLIWYGGLWSAGDAKLFLAYSALLPLSTYYNSYIFPFPSVIILVNSFVPLFVFLVIKLIIHTNFKNKVSSFKSAITTETIAALMLSFFGLSALIVKALSLFNITTDIFTKIFLLLLLYFFLEKAFGKNLIKIMVAISILMGIINFDYIMSFEFLGVLLTMIVSFIFVRYFIIRLAYDAFSRTVKIDNLKPGMMLSDIFYKKGSVYKLREGVKFNIAPSGEKLHVLTDSRSLTQDVIDRIKRLHHKGEFPFETVRVNESIPFAPIMFFGALLTIIFQGSFLLIINILTSFF
jgi:hypothetical protein